MGAASSTIRVIIEGSTQGLVAAVNEARAALGGLEEAGPGLTAALQPVAVAGFVSVLAGLAGQALSAAPALLQLGAVAGTVALGMDGIKKAAETVKPALDKLKTAVSATFEKGLTPAFQQIAKILPTLTIGFQQIAQALSNVFSKMVSQVALGTRGLTNLQTILRGAADFVRGLGDGLTQFFAAILEASAALTPQMEAFGKVIGGVLADIGQAFSNLANTGQLQAAFAGLQSTIIGIGDALNALITVLIAAGAAVGDKFGAALHLIADILRDLNPVISDLAAITADVLVGALTTFRDVVSALAGPLKGVLDVVKPLAPEIGKLAAALLLLKVSRAVITGLQGLVGGLGGLRGLGLIGLAAGIAAVAVSLDKLNVSAAGGDASKLTGTEQMLHNIVEAGKLLLTSPGEALRQIEQQIGEVADQFNNRISPIGQIWGTITDKIHAAGDALSHLGDSASPIGGLFDTIAQKFNGFVGALGQIGTNISGFFSGLGTAISGFAGQVGTVIGTALSSITAFPGQVSGALAGLSGILSGIIAGAFGGGFVGGIIGFVSQAVASVGSIPGQFSSVLSGLTGLLSGIATGAFGAFFGAAVGLIGQIVGAVAAMPGSISGALSGLAGLLSGIASTAMQAFLGAITSGASAVFGFVGSIPGRIAGAIGNLGSVLVGPGRALMDGLLSGIVAGLNAVLAFASTIAARIAAVKGPIPKDKKTLVPAGLALMQGLLSGMQSGSTEVLAFASALADQIATASGSGLIASAGSLSSTAPGAAASAPADAPVTVNVMLSQDQIAGIAQAEIIRQNRATKRTVLAGSGVTF